MKIRTGFVSNSSSSSFVLVCTQEHIDEFTKENPFCGKAADHFCASMDFNGSKVRVYSEFMDNGGYGTFDDYDPGFELTDEEQKLYEDEYEENWGEVMYEFRQFMKKYVDEKKAITIEQDW